MAQDVSTTIRKIADFTRLPRGWHYGEGVPASRLLALRAVLFLSRPTLILGSVRTDAFPGINGEIQVTIYRGKSYLELTIEPNGKTTFVRENDDVEIEYQQDLSSQEIEDRLSEWEREIWGSFGSSTTATTIRLSDVLRASPSKPPRQRGTLIPAYLSSSTTAPSGSAVQYAYT
jgi:hypothetical protein